MKVMIVVTHLLGTGHLSRALTLGRAFVADRHETFVVTGGMPATQLDSVGMTVLGLPPLRSDGTDFTRLLGQNGEVADDAYHVARATALIEAVKGFAPDVLITELFPFGRRSWPRSFWPVYRLLAIYHESQLFWVRSAIFWPRRPNPPKQSAPRKSFLNIMTECLFIPTRTLSRLRSAGRSRIV